MTELCNIKTGVARRASSGARTGPARHRGLNVAQFGRESALHKLLQQIDPSLID